jgi:RNA polymerase sigma-70 factor (ECF subfamily)
MDVPNVSGVTNGEVVGSALQDELPNSSGLEAPSPRIASKLMEQESRDGFKDGPAKHAAPPAIAPPSDVPANTAASEAQSADAAILAKAQGGDHAAFAQLYSVHKRRVYSLCLRMLGNVAEAEDLTQEAFLQLHRKIATFRGDSAFSTWLHRLTINVVLMHLRRKGLNLISLDEALDPSPDHGPTRSFGAPDLRLTGSIDRMTLEKAVENLPAGYRLIFVLHDIEGYEHNEIATLLDCSIGNSKSQLHKARMKLREALRAPADEEVTK